MGVEISKYTMTSARQFTLFDSIVCRILTLIASRGVLHALLEVTLQEIVDAYQFSQHYVLEHDEKF